MQALPGTSKVEFCFGALGLDLVQDEVTHVSPGGQAEVKGVKVGWKISMVSGQPMSDVTLIRGEINKARRTGKHFFIIFSKPASELQADLMAAANSPRPSEHRRKSFREVADAVRAEQVAAGISSRSSERRRSSFRQVADAAKLEGK
eukprot:GEMP01046827.1.p1 GENE.GEMP01046827.1~~GEMP01046827.1.p1  ORF type:complete len:147 (+),score=29.74 GEMP01046827.1:105-545(+)